MDSVKHSCPPPSTILTLMLKSFQPFHTGHTCYLKGSMSLQVMDRLKQFLGSKGIGYSEKVFETNTSIAGLREPIVS